VVKLLPFVLVDLAETADNAGPELGDMVIYFLNVSHPFGDFENEAQRLRYIREKELYFSLFDQKQAAAVYEWICYIAALPNFNWGIGRGELLHARTYWRRKASNLSC
jgi:hypothetical protein